MSNERKGISGKVAALVAEPVEKLAGFTWKLAAFGSLLAVALGATYASLKLAMLSVGAAILEQQVKSSQPSKA